ncbi:Uncharacterised protein [Acidipropionibacterium jensenii]|uniref:Uncharacterized protein n=1 Tax=Acidipropionibacterium jensenii TaxID=1749 RepID=A0A448NVV1_9ACTN|nr:hypothetical protein [Corynebacterium variabile]VEI02093.1 Uncharacterised protein [Acidipropionibacterium jensenii]
MSIWAGTIVVTIFPLVSATSRWNRRSVIIAALAVLTFSSALSAGAPTMAG